MLQFLIFAFFVTSTGIFASNTKFSWTKEEDAFLLEHITYCGAKEWRKIANALNEKLHKDDGSKRKGKQCRERWHNQLDPRIKKGHWTAEEDELIIRTVSTYGKEWAKISRNFFKGSRTDNDIKNRWNSTLRRGIVPSGSVDPSLTVGPSLIVKTPSKKRKESSAADYLKNKATSHDETSDDDSEDETDTLAVSARISSSRYPARNRTAPDFFANTNAPMAPKKPRSTRNTTAAPLPDRPTRTNVRVLPLATDTRVEPSSPPLLAPIPLRIYEEFPSDASPDEPSFENHFQGEIVPIASQEQRPLLYTPTSTDVSASPLATYTHIEPLEPPLLASFLPGIHSEFPSDDSRGCPSFKDHFQDMIASLMRPPYSPTCPDDDITQRFPIPSAETQNLSRLSPLPATGPEDLDFN